MSIVGTRRSRLDSRLALKPRNYVTRPQDFGRGPVRIQLPQGGTQQALRVAVVQHRVVRAYRSKGRGKRKPIQHLAAMYGMSEATLNRVLAGQAWASATALAALLDATSSDVAPSPSGASRVRPIHVKRLT